MNDIFHDAWRYTPKALRVLVASLALAACVPMQAQDHGRSHDDDDSGDESASSGGQTAPGSGDSCNTLLTCMQGCVDDACANACYANGSDAGRQKMDALLKCITDSMCTDPACTKMACAPEIDACTGDVAAPTDPTDPGPPATPGTLPTELVGDWEGHQAHYHFDANGSYFFVGILSTDGSCITTEQIVFKDSGVASATGNSLTLTADDNTQETTDCSGQVTTKTASDHTDQFTWSINGTTLTLVGPSGAIEYTRQ